MTTEELAEVLRLHDLWTKIDKRGLRGIFKNEDLSGVDLSNCNLYNVAFINCNLSGINFTGAITQHLFINECNLDNVNFTGIDLDNIHIFNSSTKTIIK